MKFMSSLKPAWHVDKIKELQEGENITPTHLQLIISDLCNQNCHFCAYRMDGGFSTELFWEGENRNPARFIPLEKAREILLDYRALGGKAVEFTGGGEPTAHKDHLEIIGYAQSLGLETGLVTNGVRLKDHDVFRNLDWLRISLDAGTEETYERVRESKAWKRVIDNLGVVSQFNKPLVGVGFVVTRENYHEIAEAALIVKESGISYMRVSALFSEEGSKYYDGLDVHVPDYEWVVNLFPDRVNDLDQEAPDYSFCGYQQFVNYIGADLKIYTCCTNAYTLHGQIGDLSNRTYADWLMNEDRTRWDSRSCHHCQFNDKNRLIDYLVSNPPHVNFV